MSQTRCICLFAFAAVLAAAVPLEYDTEDAKKDLVTDLPGLTTKLSFAQYAGYIDVSPSHGRNLFYWLVESTKDNAPLVFWFNGGPGCSSLAGFLGQHGPFWPNEQGELQMRSTSWNQVANVVYLESPSGVGFSYSTDKSDYTVGDERTADDAYHFILQFLERFPRYQNSPLWITGESYGGHYVPNLTARIVRGNQAKEGLHVNLQGFMVGNAWTVAPDENRGALDFWYGHSMVSNVSVHEVIATCNFSRIGPIMTEEDAASNDACDKAVNYAMSSMGPVNIYDAYEDVCVDGTAQGQRLLEVLGSGEDAHAVFGRALHDAHSMPPCIDAYVASYLNQPAVMKALHTNISYKWNECSPFLNYSRSDLLSSMMPVYDFLLQQDDLRMLVYSGDVDAIVPFTGTRHWLHDLGLEILQPHTPWTVNNQTGGYSVLYKGLSYTTVRNAGHMVHGTQPERGFHMFSRFLENKPF